VWSDQISRIANCHWVPDQASRSSHPSDSVFERCLAPGLKRNIVKEDGGAGERVDSGVVSGGSFGSRHELIWTDCDIAKKMDKRE